MHRDDRQREVVPDETTDTAAGWPRVGNEAIARQGPRAPIVPHRCGDGGDRPRPTDDLPSVAIGLRYLWSRVSGLPRAVCGFACCGVGLAGAESGASTTKDMAETRPPIFAQPAATEKSAALAGGESESAAMPRRRVSSPELAAKISSVIMPPLLLDGGTQPAAGTSVPLPVEQPGVVRLQRYVVRERRLPDFKDRDLLTIKGKAALARRRYPAAGSAALALLEEDFAIERRKEAAEYSELVAVAGTELPSEVKRLMKDATLRRNEFTPTFGRPR